MRYNGTDVDGLVADASAMEIRGRDLRDLIGGTGFFEACALTLGLQDGFAERIEPLFDWVASHWELRSAPSQAALLVLQSGGTPVECAVAGFMVPWQQWYDSAVIESAVRPLNDFPGLIEGLVVSASLPYLLAVGIHGERAVEPAGAMADSNQGFLTRAFAALFGAPAPQVDSVGLFERLLVSWMGGLGCLPPTVIVPRMVAGTGAPTQAALAAGLLASGTNHIGAASEAVALIRDVMATAGSGLTLESSATLIVDRTLNSGRHIPGFGHPIFEDDPRATTLRAMYADLIPEHPALLAYDALITAVAERAKLSPNIDLATAALVLGMGGVHPAMATSVALTGRVIGMIAHVNERRAKPPFGMHRESARRQMKFLPTNWL